MFIYSSHKDIFFKYSFVITNSDSQGLWSHKSPNKLLNNINIVKLLILEVKIVFNYFPERAINHL
jgi:hypothetical protein